jgi:peptidyl-prolyl cis-trans isomerase B (cyclophilin B)
VVEKIGKVETDSNNKPKAPQIIKSLRVDTKGIKYREPLIIKQ